MYMLLYFNEQLYVTALYCYSDFKLKYALDLENITKDL